MSEQILSGYSDQSAHLVGTIPGADALRQKAFESFSAARFPTQKTEDWRYSDMRALSNTLYTLATAPKAAPSLPEEMCETAAHLVFVNGAYNEDLSDLKDLWQAVPVRSLANHFMSNTDRVNELVEGHDGISLLNTALLRDGIVFYVPSGVEIDEPVEIVHIMTEAEGAAAHVRHVIELGENANITLLERFVGDASNYWTNSVLQARVAEGATFKHIRMQEEGENALHTAKAYLNLGAKATYEATNVSIGGKTARFEAHARVLVNGAHASINGVALAATGQSHDVLTHVSHLVPEATSEQVYRTVADSRGKTSFQGKVTVAKDAQQTEADQSFKALVFDNTAEANAKPELEILADDVKCSHGATIGQLDDKAIFYLTSRGIDPSTARQMLVEAFAADALVSVTQGDLMESLMDRIKSWMNSRKDKAVVA